MSVLSDTEVQRFDLRRLLRFLLHHDGGFGEAHG